MKSKNKIKQEYRTRYTPTHIRTYTNLWHTCITLKDTQAPSHVAVGGSGWWVWSGQVMFGSVSNDYLLCFKKKLHQLLKTKTSESAFHKWQITFLLRRTCLHLHDLYLFFSFLLCLFSHLSLSLLKTRAHPGLKNKNKQWKRSKGEVSKTVYVDGRRKEKDT